MTTAAFEALLGGVVERRELDRGGRALRWLEAGKGSPTIVLEAGSMSPVVSFAAIVKQLAPDHRVIAYDRAGYGASDATHIDVQQQLDDLVALLEQVGPSILVGHSWGGLLAQLATWARPDLINGLVLIDPSHERFWSELTPETRAEMGRHPSRTAPPSEDPRTADVLAFARELANDVASSVGDELMITACMSYLETDEQLFMYLDEVPMILDHLDDLAARRTQSTWPGVPVVLLTATKGRPKDSTAQVIAIQDQVAAAANAPHVIVPDAGHYIHVDRPDLVVKWIRNIAHQTAPP